MATQRPSFEKLQRERDKKAKNAAKRDRRLARESADPAADEAPPAVPPRRDTAELLAAVEKLHEQFENEQVPYEEYERRKAELLALLPID